MPRIVELRKMIAKKLVLLNELGRPVKKGDILLRDAETGFPLYRMGDARFVSQNIRPVFAREKKTRGEG